MNVDRQSEAFFSALASQTRLHIIEMLCERSMNIRELAQGLGLSSSITARHVHQMEAAGILRCESVAAERGLQKRCSLAMDSVQLTFEKKRRAAHRQVFELTPGQYSDFEVQPTCGLIMANGVLGCFDDPRYFADPRHGSALCLWIGHGYLEYIIPNYFDSSLEIMELRVEMEICSEAPGFAMDWPSDIYFSINGVALGFWTSPGDFGGQPGFFSPEWYRERGASQYGQLKQLTVNRQGSFIDGIRISAQPIGALNLPGGQPVRLRIESPPDARNPRGFTLFGKGFGNYDQNIVVTMEGSERIP